MSATARSKILEWALYYHAKGLSIVPLSSKGKFPGLDQWAPFQEHRAGPEQLESWFTGIYRHRGLGVVTGPVSDNIFLFDADTKEGQLGEESLHNLQWENDELPHTWQGRTGSGGEHRYFKAPPGFIVKNSTSLIAPNIDIRGRGGFAVLPPSIHPETGREYEWIKGSTPDDIEVADAPDWLLALVEDKEGGDATSQTGPRTRTYNAAPGNTGADAFGRINDGREQYMRDLVWAGIVEMRREFGDDPPSEEELSELFKELWPKYQAHVRSTPGMTLDAEGRGEAEMRRKIKYAAKRWDTRVKRDAEKPKPNSEWSNPNSGSGFTFNDNFEQPKADPTKPLILTAAAFVAGFVAPVYVIDGVIQRSYIYSCTAKTGHGKTAIAMYGGYCIATGADFHGRVVKQGRVLFLAGENPDDVRARYLVTADYFRFEASQAPFHFISGVVGLASEMPRIHAEAAAIGGDFTTVWVDTAAAYFPGDDGNSNAQQGGYARLLRQLTTLPGKPAVIVNSHPVKNAARDNLLPVGGGAFLNEVDGNLTLWSAADGQTELHWQGKFRGPEFEPMPFQMLTHTCDSVKDAEGRLMPSVVAKPVTALEADLNEKQTESDDNRVLLMIGTNPKLSMANMARALGWINDKGEPQKAKVQRAIMRLRDDQMVKKYRGSKSRITDKGRREVGLGNDDD